MYTCGREDIMKLFLKERRGYILEHTLISAAVIVLMVVLTLFGFKNNENTSKEVALVEREERMAFNVENTILQVENYKETLINDYNTEVANLETEFIGIANKGSLDLKWKELQSHNGILKFCDILVETEANSKVVWEKAGKSLESHYNGNESNYDKTIKAKIYNITISLPPEYIYNQTLEFIKDNMHSAVYSSNEYVWVNQILNYNGGDDYAIRLIHPNLVDTEGQFLSTGMEDAAGELPYKKELDGVVEESKNDKGFFQDYYFKNKVNDKQELKHSYAKLYKPYNWIIATGIPYCDIYMSVSDIYEESLYKIMPIWIIGLLVIIVLNSVLIRKNKKETDRLLEAEQENIKAKERFIAKTNHDMRTPMNGILGLTKLTLQEKNLDKVVSENLTQIEHSANYLLELINDMLDINRIQNNQYKINKTPNDVNKLIEDIIKTAKANAAYKNINLVAKNNLKGVEVIEVDVSRYKQICFNIINNAIKFTPEKGIVNIEFTSRISNKDKNKTEGTKVNNQERNKTEAVVDIIMSVKDSGVGISEDFLPNIFDPFAREYDDSKDQFGGCGLGLYIAQSVSKIMGGNIEVESKVGQGTAFTVEMPFVMTLIPKEDYDFTGKRILLCEDHPLNQKITTKLLENKNAEVIHAENGEIGLKLFKESQPNYFDLILMDIRMPVMDGLEASSEIRRLARIDAKDIPIIAISANAFEEDIKKSTEMGIDYYLSKPIVTETLYLVVCEYLNL